jgi:alpha-L-fucosidase 2
MYMKFFLSFISLFLFSFSLLAEDISINKSENDLVFGELASTWDEAVPLGNAMLGVLVWQKGDNLRFSLDRVDLWDLRPMENLKLPEWRHKWVYEQWKKKRKYKKVQKLFDERYDKDPAPSKIPAGALEFNTQALGSVKSVRLSVTDAACEVIWNGGVRMQTFVHASEQCGWFRFEGVDDSFVPEIVAPPYSIDGKSGGANSLSGHDLRRLGYSKGSIVKDGDRITYVQEGWGGFKYEINVTWKREGDSIDGCWSISSEFPSWKKSETAGEVVNMEIEEGFENAFQSHKSWWENYWNASSLSVPDKVLEKQWYLEMYKFGSAARKGAPPIALQAVWTADHGKLPPWKGDFHHDLNTQLSYWPAYSGNHLELEEGFIDWLLKYKKTFKRYTREYFETDGLNVPGVTTLEGEPMGGWIQYSFGPTVSSWLAHHFYLHWRYTMDRDFLADKAYPWIKDVAVYLDEMSVRDKNGKRKLLISSSPEIRNKERDAWFGETTNYDLALIIWTFEKAAELATELNLDNEAEKWTKILGEWPGYAIDKKEGLMFAPSLKYSESHRHFSHLMAIHPLGLIDWSDGQEAQSIINNTIQNLEHHGSDYWTGYSFSWLANIKARMYDGEGAAEQLKIFAECFCLPNSFHVNGDQSGKGYSKFTYRPFTLEGNFAFASGLQEMLIQSHTGIVNLFPAIPQSWKDVRTEGAFLVSAEMKGGKVASVKISSEKGGTVKLKNPFEGSFTTSAKYRIEGDLLIIEMSAGEELILIGI